MSCFHKGENSGQSPSLTARQCFNHYSPVRIININSNLKQNGWFKITVCFLYNKSLPIIFRSISLFPLNKPQSNSVDVNPIFDKSGILFRKLFH